MIKTLLCVALPCSLVAALGTHSMTRGSAILESPAASAAPVSLTAGEVSTHQAPNAPSAAAPASRFNLDPIHSAAMFRVQHLQAGQFWGRINALMGSVEYSDDDSAAPVLDVTAKVANLDTGSEKLDKNLQGPNFFNALEFPELRFRSTSGERISALKWRVKGNLTIHGVTQPVETEVEVTGIGVTPTARKAGFEATLRIQRSSFGMPWGVEKPPNVLGDAVNLLIALEGDEVKP